MIIILNGKVYNARHTPFCIISNFSVDKDHLANIKKLGDSIHLHPPEWSFDQDKMQKFIDNNIRLYKEYNASGEPCKDCDKFINCEECGAYQDLPKPEEKYEVEFKINKDGE